ncbi:MAG: tetratricopeptide repeat protein, partial [Planctomycetes bacterium]|nr:tetratricopeptide repeat protein [Planctomycetota bacterium]
MGTSFQGGNGEGSSPFPPSISEAEFLARSKRARDEVAALWDVDNYSAAEQLCREWLSAAIMNLGEVRSETAAWMDCLAATLRFLCRFDDALQHAERGLEILRTRLPDGHPDIGVSCGNLGFLLYKMRRLEEAERFLKESIDVLSKSPSVGPDHVRTADCYDRYSSVLKELGRFDDAENLCRQALGIRRSRLGEDHRLTTVSKNNLAEIIKKRSGLARRTSSIDPVQGEGRAGIAGSLDGFLSDLNQSLRGDA